uniref:Uncharacterized protein n=1 Tax=Plectus sambesii TaxID=2011161 RepID=A0A914WIN9_9BILA
MTIFTFLLFFFTTFCNGQLTSNSSCGHSSGTKYNLYQYETKGVGTKNYHLVTTAKQAVFDHSEVLGSVLSQMDKSCNCLMEVVNVHKDETSWFGFSRKIDNMLISNVTVPKSFSLTEHRFICAREKNACGATLALRTFYKEVNDDHFYETKNDTNMKEVKELDILCYIWPESDNQDAPTTTKEPATAQQNKATAKSVAKTAEAAVKVASKHLGPLPTVGLETSMGGSSSGPIVKLIELDATVSSQPARPAILVVWDHSRNLSIMERVTLYIEWYNTSIEYINSVSNGTPEDYRHYMPYYPGPPIFDNEDSYPSNPKYETPTTEHHDKTPTAAVTKATGHQDKTPTAAVSEFWPISASTSHPIYGPWPIPAFNFSSDVVLETLARMNLTLDELRAAYESWLQNTTIFLAQYYGPEWILPNGTHIQKHEGQTKPIYHGNSPMDSSQLFGAYDDWLSSTKVILANLLTDNHRFAAYLNNQPSKSLAKGILHHIANPPLAHALNSWPTISNSSRPDTNFQELQTAYEKWYKEVNRLNGNLSISQNANDPKVLEKSESLPKTSSDDTEPHTFDINLDKLVEKAIPQLLAASNNGTNSTALHAAYHSWLDSNQKTHEALAHYVKKRQSES